MSYSPSKATPNEASNSIYQTGNATKLSNL